MKHKKNKSLLFGGKAAYMITGVIVGAVLFGGGFALASSREAVMNVTYRDVKIVVDGVQITPKDAAGNTVEPFISDGTTYLPVRAVSEALGKEVSWDGNNSTVYIGKAPTASPTGSSVADRLSVTAAGDGSYDIKVTGDAIAGKLANGADINEANILAMLAELEEIFPDGTSWGDGKNGTRYSYRSPFSPILSFGSACNSWAYMTADLLYGCSAEFTKHNDLSKVKCGDIVRLLNSATKSEHWIVVMGTGKDSESLPLFYSSEGNVSGEVIWNTKNYLKGTQNDYPNSIIYSFY